MATAERAGLHRTEVSLVERGERLPRLDTIVKLAGALEEEPCELLRGMAWKLNPPKKRGIERSKLGQEDEWVERAARQRPTQGGPSGAKGGSRFVSPSSLGRRLYAAVSLTNVSHSPLEVMPPSPDRRRLGSGLHKAAYRA